MARRKKGKKVALKAAPKAGKVPAKKPRIQWGTMAEAAQNPVIKNFSALLSFMSKFWEPSVFDFNDPEYFDEEDMTVERTVDGSKMIDDVVEAFNAGKKPVVKCGDFKYIVSGISVALDGRKGFCASGAAIVGGELKTGMIVVSYDPQTNQSTSQFVGA